MLKRELEKWSARTGKTRAEAAVALGVSGRMVRMWLNGSMPKPATLKRLADMLGVDPVELMDSIRDEGRT